MLRITIDNDIDLATVCEYSKCKNDIVYFAEKYINIIHLDKGVVPFKAYEYQKDILRMNHFFAINARQIGTSIIANIKLIHIVLFNNENRSIGFFGHSRDNTKFNELYELCSYPIKPKAIINNKQNVKFDYVSIKFGKLTDTSIRGYSFTDVFLDDIAFVDQEHIEALRYSTYRLHNRDGKHVIWAFGCASTSNNNSNIYRMSPDPMILPFWVTNDELYLRYKHTSELIGKRNADLEYLCIPTE